MKNQQIFKSRIIPLILSVFLLSLNSCKKDESTDPNEDVTDEEVLFKVELVKLTGTETPESDGLHEVYGTITARLNVDNLYDETTIWMQGSASYVSAGEEGYELVGIEVFTIRESEISRSSIDLSAELMDYDGENNDAELLGDVTNSVNLEEVTSEMTYEIVLDESAEHTALLTYSITRL